MKKILLMSLLVLGFAFQAQANEEMNEHQGHGPCAQDRKKLCGDIKHGDGRMMKCMEENEEKLSPECKAHRDQMKSSMHEMMGACKADAEKHCGEMKHGHGEMMKCMHEHKGDMSKECQEHMHGMMKNKKMTDKKSSKKQDKSEDKKSSSESEQAK